MPPQVAGVGAEAHRGERHLALCLDDLHKLRTERAPRVRWCGVSACASSCVGPVLSVRPLAPGRRLCGLLRTMRGSQWTVPVACRPCALLLGGLWRWRRRQTKESMESGIHRRCLGHRFGRCDADDGWCDLFHNFGVATEGTFADWRCVVDGHHFSERALLTNERLKVKRPHSGKCGNGGEGFHKCYGWFHRSNSGRFVGLIHHIGQRCLSLSLSLNWAQLLLCNLAVSLV